ncbi:MAG: porin [Betaproteobacteria bacterium]|nr:porin [Betaproteobacteria bacterium]
MRINLGKRKNLVLAAVTVALTAPASAFAAGTTLTITGYFRVGIESYSISNSVGRANSSQFRLTDNSSRIDFAVNEDLGEGLSAIAYVSSRINPTTTGGSTWGTGATWVGLRDERWGTVTFGNKDLHYYHLSDTVYVTGATAEDAWAVGLLSYVNNAGKNQAIASATRTPNTVEYVSPTWGLFSFSAAWSANRAGSPADMGPAAGAVTTRRGDAWNFAPQLHGGNWVAGYSYWRSKADLGAEPDQRSDRLWGYYQFPQGFYVGLTWDKSKLENAATGADIAGRNAWSIPVAYSWGSNRIGYTYTRADDDKVLGSGTGAKLNAIYYNYALSKRTQVAVTYAHLNNDSKAVYNLYSTSLGSTDVATLSPGESPRALQVTLNLSF